MTKNKASKPNKKKSLLIGITTGFLNGLFGAGGGIIAVLMLEKHLEVEEHKAHATAIAIILPLSMLSAVIYMFKAEVMWLPLYYISLGGIVGGLVGAKLLTKFSPKWLHVLFGGFMIIAAGRLIFGS